MAPQRAARGESLVTRSCVDRFCRTWGCIRVHVSSREGLKVRERSARAANRWPRGKKVFPTKFG